MMTKTIDELVNRFLRWKLPEGFSPDGGISFKRIPDFPELNKWEYEPVGTNLFTAVQAKEMFEYCLKEEPVVLNNMSNTPEQVAKYTRQNSPDISKELSEHFKPQALLSQGDPTVSKTEIVEPIGYLRFKTINDVTFVPRDVRFVLHGASPHITTYPDLPLYLATPATSQGKPVYFYRNKEGDGYSAWFETDNKFYEFVQDLSHGGYYQWRKLFAAPPSTEALQKDKEELIEYVKKLHSALENIRVNRFNLEYNHCEAIYSLAIPQPKCME